MNYCKQLLVLAFVFLGIQAYTQENVFLDRAFWQTKPTLEEVKTKVAEGNSPTQRNENNFDPLVNAIMAHADEDILTYFLNQPGNDINKLTHDGRTYIFWAAYSGNVPLMKDILKRGAKTDIIDDHGYTVLNFAATTGQQNKAVYDLCLDFGADLQNDLNHDGANALLLAAPHDKDGSLIAYFTGKELNLKSTDANGNSIFSYVARTGNLDLLKSLVKKGVAYDDNAVIFASQGTRGKTNGLDVFTYLESLGLNPAITTPEGINALHALASRSDDLKLINYFIKKGVDVNQADKDGNTVFMNAAGRNKLTIIKELLPYVKDINAVNEKGISALAMAVNYNTPEAVAFLINNKATIQVSDHNGNNLAYYLIRSYNPRNPIDFETKLKTLKAQGLDVTKPQADGNTLFHLALDTNDLALLEKANQFNIDINAKNKAGITPLHKAAMKAKDDTLLKYLITNGAQKNVLTDFDETPYELALENELLQKQAVSLEFLK